MTVAGRLRVVDDGTVGALRSQALWHGIAGAMEPEGDPTLSFCRPGEPYVGLGYHGALAEIDLAHCQREGLQVIRRQIGGGPVFLDPDQQFFQLTLPAVKAPPRVDRLYEMLLEPAAEAFRRLGLDVDRRGLNDLAIDDRKISGTGAGRIGNGVTVVGNLLFRFPHRRMAATLALPSASMRAEYVRLMERYVTSVEAEGRQALEDTEVKQALIEGYSSALGLRPEQDCLDPIEEDAVAAWEHRFTDREWLEGAPSTAASGRQVKVSGGVWLVSAGENGYRIELSTVDGRIENARVATPATEESGDAIAAALIGQATDDGGLGRTLEAFGPAGRSILTLLGPALKRAQ